MPCKKYKGSQRRLCFATKEWKDFSKVKINSYVRKGKRIKSHIRRIKK